VTEVSFELGQFYHRLKTSAFRHAYVQESIVLSRLLRR